jgi:hypothetical protein
MVGSGGVMVEETFCQGDEVMNSTTGEKLIFDKLSSWPSRAECIDSEGKNTFPMIKDVVLLSRRKIV